MGVGKLLTEITINYVPQSPQNDYNTVDTPLKYLIEYTDHRDAHAPYNHLHADHAALVRTDTLPPTPYLFPPVSLTIHGCLTFCMA